MEGQALASIVIILITIAFSYKGFNEQSFEDKYVLDVFKVINYKEYYRIFSSALLHGDYGHLIFNMFSFYCFASLIEMSFGVIVTLSIYLFSIFGGSMLALYIHRKHEYLAYGASGGVSGIIFASIFLFPDMSLSPLLFPIPIPAWFFAILYTGISIYGIVKGNIRNIGHDAHLGGALCGLLITGLMYPQAIMANIWLFIAIVATTSLFLYYLIINPLFLNPKHVFSFLNKEKLQETIVFKKKETYDDKEEMDRLLAKVSEKGFGNLSKKEKAHLVDISKRLNKK